MSSSKSAVRLTRRFALLGISALAGCGFAPVYGDLGRSTSHYGAVTFDTDDSLDGYHLRDQLEQRLGTGQNAEYQLTVRLSVTDSSVAISTDDATLRTTLSGKAVYVFSTLTGTTVAEGEVNSFTGYSNTGSTVSIRSARQDAHERLATALADLIVAQLMAL